MNEKKRSGRDLLEVQFKKLLEFACFRLVGSIFDQPHIGDRVTR